MVFLHQLNRCLRTDTSNTRIIVTRVTLKSLNVNDLGGCQTIIHFSNHGWCVVVHFSNSLFSYPNRNIVGDQLRHITVSRHNCHRISGCFSHTGSCPDDIIGFVTRKFVRLDTVQFNHLTQWLELFNQFLRCLITVPLIVVKLSCTECRLTGIPRNQRQIRLKRINNTVQQVIEAYQSVCV